MKTRKFHSVRDTTTWFQGESINFPIENDVNLSTHVRHLLFKYLKLTSACTWINKWRTSIELAVKNPMERSSVSVLFKHSEVELFLASNRTRTLTKLQKQFEYVPLNKLDPLMALQ